MEYQIMRMELRSMSENMVAVLRRQLNSNQLEAVKWL